VDLRHAAAFPAQGKGKPYLLELGNHGHLHYDTAAAAAPENGWKSHAKMGAGRYPWMGADASSFGEQRDNILEAARWFQKLLGFTPRSWAKPGRCNDADTARAAMAAGCEVLSGSDIRARDNVLFQPPPHHPGGTDAVELTSRYPPDPQHVHISRCCDSGCIAPAVGVADGLHVPPAHAPEGGAGLRAFHGASAAERAGGLHANLPSTRCSASARIGANFESQPRRVAVALDDARLRIENRSVRISRRCRWIWNWRTAAGPRCWFRSAPDNRSSWNCRSRRMPLVCTVDVEDWAQSTLDTEMPISERAGPNMERVLDVLPKKT
jgi:hypothetical protein